MERYQTVMAAVRCVRTAATAEFSENKLSPAWAKLVRVVTYLEKQAEHLMEGRAEDGAEVVEAAAPVFEPVSAEHAEQALIYRDGILDYDAHDAYLQDLGYEHLALPCKCGGTEDDGHLPCCGWGRKVTAKTVEQVSEFAGLQREVAL